MNISLRPRSAGGRARCVLHDVLAEADIILPPHAGMNTVIEKTKGTEIEQAVKVLVEIIDGPKKIAFCNAIQKCLDEYRWPSGRAIRWALGKPGHSETLSGDEARWRREFLMSRGWRLGTGRGSTQKIIPPKQWQDAQQGVKKRKGRK